MQMPPVVKKSARGRKTRGAEQEPPRGEGAVPLPREAGREGEAAKLLRGSLPISVSVRHRQRRHVDDAAHRRARREDVHGTGGAQQHGADGNAAAGGLLEQDRKSTRLNSSHLVISYAVFCLKKKKKVANSEAQSLQERYE